MKPPFAQLLIQSKPILVTGIAVIVITIVVGIRQVGLLQEPELATYDRYLRWRPANTQWVSPVVLINIHEEDIQRFRHPLSDELLARVLTKLLALEPRAIGVVRVGKSLNRLSLITRMS